MQKITAENNSIFFLPILSENIPAGMLKITPVNAETAAMNPTPDGSAPKWNANRGRTGLFDIVELKTAKSPVVQSTMKGLNFIFP